MDTATVTILATSINLLSDNHNHRHRPQLMQPGRLGAPFVQMPQHSFRLDAVWRVQGGEFPMEDPGRVYYKLGVADGGGRWNIIRVGCILEAEHNSMLQVAVRLVLRSHSALGAKRHQHANRAHLRALDLFVGVQLVAPVPIPTGRNRETSIFTTRCWGCSQLDSLELLAGRCSH